MLAYIFLFLIGYYFYRLAENHSKNKWLFGVLGIAFYYTSSIVFDLIYGFIFVDEISEFDAVSFGLMTAGVGIFSCVILFHSLDYVWSKKAKAQKNDVIDEIGKALK